MQTTDGLTRYLKEIAAFPRITSKREAELSRTILRSRDPAKVEAATNELVQANLRLVVHCLKEFTRFVELAENGLTAMDLVAEGNIGLIKAAQGFNVEFSNSESRGKKSGSPMKFSSYACKCIKRRMLRAIKRSKFIRVPENHFSYRKKIADLESSNGGCVGDRQIRKQLGIRRRKLQRIREGMKCQTFFLEDMSLSDEGLSWREIVSNDHAVQPDNELARHDLRAFLEREMQSLKPRTRDMLAKLFLSDSRTTFADLAAEYGISKERCRQICCRGLELLRQRIEPKWGKTLGLGMSFGKADLDASEDAVSQSLVPLLRSARSSDAGAFRHVA